MGQDDNETSTLLRSDQEQERDRPLLRSLSVARSVDLRDASGREVGPGTYLARLEFGGRVETMRMGLVR